jgi:hypothetical protein
MPKTVPSTASESPDGMHLGGCLIRLYWMLIGNAALIMCVAAILTHRGGFLSVADIVYWVLVITMGVARFVDIRKFGGRTAAGQPASATHWRRYLVFLIVASSVIWGAAHLGAYLELLSV